MYILVIQNVAIGVLFIILAVPLLRGRVPPNSMYGFRLRPAVDEDDEAGPVPLLVRLVQPGELLEHLGVVVGALLDGRPGREAAALSDRRVRGQDLDLLLVRQLVDERARLDQRILVFRQPFDEARPALEQLRELVGAQLPR